MPSEKINRHRNPSYDTTLDIEQAPAAMPRADLHDVELGEALAVDLSLGHRLHDMRALRTRYGT